jgi:hypothetical protein
MKPSSKKHALVEVVRNAKKWSGEAKLPGGSATGRALIGGTFVAADAVEAHVAARIFAAGGTPRKWAAELGSTDKTEARRGADGDGGVVWMGNDSMITAYGKPVERNRTWKRPISVAYPRDEKKVASRPRSPKFMREIKVGATRTK